MPRTCNSTILERTLAKYRQAPQGDCWVWLGKPSKDGEGYGKIDVAGHTLRAHRYVYELLVGPIPGGLDLDHLCRNTMCVNPDHLEPVTKRENTRRGASHVAAKMVQTHCSQGHELEFRRDGHRGCSICIKVTHKRKKERYRQRDRLMKLL